MQPLRTHKDLDVWKQSIKLAGKIYEITENYPKAEIYGIVSQMRRAVV
jgi:four helix bundle protein